jgi:hypothetical protein
MARVPEATGGLEGDAAQERPTAEEDPLDITGLDASRQGATSSPKMADPFEVRMRFTSQLQHLNASVTSAQKAAQYALKYKEMDEDLHSCILEQLERVCVPPCPLASLCAVADLGHRIT